MALQKPAAPVAANIDIVGIEFHTRRDPATGEVSGILGGILVTRSTAGGRDLEPVRGEIGDLTPTQQTWIANILAAIRTFGNNNLLG